MFDFSKWREKYQAAGSKAQLVVLPLMALVAIGAVILAIVAIIALPAVYNVKDRGVGAYGFKAFVEEGTDLGVGDVLSKKIVKSELGNKSLSVDDADVSGVFNIDGNRGQTATFDFLRADGADSGVYVDLMLFKNSSSMDGSHILSGTGKAGTIQGHPAYFMRAQTLGYDREYRLMVVNGLKVYKFVMTQPHKNVTINEVTAVAALKRMAEKANL